MMAKLGSAQYGLAGYSCVSKPRCTQDDPDAPLMYALGYALGTHNDLGHFLRAIFPPYPNGAPGGGDPGWIWYREKDGSGKDVIVVELDAVIAPSDGVWAIYSEMKIRYEVRAALSNYAIMSPKRLADVNAVIHKYGLVEVENPAGLAMIPAWTGELPAQIVKNE
ncbi:hypothetical protein [Roseateles sp. P5_D6]